MTQKEYDSIRGKCKKTLKVEKQWIDFSYMDDFGGLWVNDLTGECLFIPSDHGRDDIREKLVRRAAAILGVSK